MILNANKFHDIYIMEKHEAFVYKWTNLSLGSIYIGYHKGSFSDGYICSSKNAIFWDDFKNENYKWEREILFEGSQEDCVIEELRLLNEVDLYSDKVYNNSKAGHIIFTDEVRKKMALRKLGKKRPPITEETRKRMSEAKLGKVYTLETRARMSKAKKGVPPPNKGVPHSDEARKKMSLSAQNKPKKHLGFYSYCLENHKEILNAREINVLEFYIDGVTVLEICKRLNINEKYIIKNILRSIKTKVSKINSTPYHT